MNLRFPLAALLGILILTSCVSGKDITYYQQKDMQALDQEVAAAVNSLKIKPNDLLTISVSAKNLEGVQPFNLAVVGVPNIAEPTRVNSQPQMQTYLVDADGNIKFPILGTIPAAGLTRQELAANLEEQVALYVQEPIVNIRIANFQITVLGEVNRPGTYTIPDEHVSLNKALGFAGYLTEYGQRKNVMIIREEGGKRTYSYVDLTDVALLNSPHYYLQQNDVIYVEPNPAQKQAGAYNRNATVYISIASVLISLAILLTK